MFLGKDIGGGPDGHWRGTASLYAAILTAFLCTVLVAAVSDSRVDSSGQQVAQTFGRD
jgi:hypothetical protein